jgi:hypothetical protein
MRKRPMAPTLETVPSQDEDSLDLERAAVVEVTSEEEEKDFPVEAALVLGETRGWRAAEPGPRTIRLLFDQLQRIKRIALVFEEDETIRTQEFVLRWSPDRGKRFREIVRQQWNFRSPATVREVEDYRVELPDVAVLELKIVPNISGGASLKRLRLFPG